MVRDDLEACLQAYRFAELLLAGWRAKPEKEQREALTAAQRLRDDVEPRYLAALAADGYSADQRERLSGARQELDRALSELADRL